MNWPMFFKKTVNGIDKWYAKFRLNDKMTVLGGFDSKKEAETAYQQNQNEKKKI